MFMAPIPSTTDTESLNKLLEILLGNFAVLVAVVVGTLVFLIRHWRKKIKEKDKENQQLKDRERKLAELCNQASGYIDMISSEVIKTEPSIVKWATWWSLSYHNLDINGTAESKEMIKRIISRKDL